VRRGEALSDAGDAELALQLIDQSEKVRATF